MYCTKKKATTSNLSRSYSESGDEYEDDNEFLQDAYEMMYTQWLKVCATNPL